MPASTDNPHSGHDRDRLERFGLRVMQVTVADPGDDRGGTVRADIMEPRPRTRAAQEQCPVHGR